eukprot:GHUV01040869.1.p1 GENE.GHUV01040869.1~~GHUV01040869.1.p1  ORF type:complete len:155 (-),score=23.85 GHUV01040869.1:221-685(-)
MAGMAMDPTAEKPVRNLPASTQPLANDPRPYVSEPTEPKKRYGIGTSTYIRPVNMGHQFRHSTQPSICSSTPVLNINANTRITGRDISTHPKQQHSSTQVSNKSSRVQNNEIIWKERVTRLQRTSRVLNSHAEQLRQNQAPALRLYCMSYQMNR